MAIADLVDGLHFRVAEAAEAELFERTGRSSTELTSRMPGFQRIGGRLSCVLAFDLRFGLKEQAFSAPR